MNPNSAASGSISGTPLRSTEANKHHGTLERKDRGGGAAINQSYGLKYVQVSTHNGSCSHKSANQSERVSSRPKANTPHKMFGFIKDALSELILSPDYATVITLQFSVMQSCNESPDQIHIAVKMTSSLLLQKVSMSNGQKAALS